MNPDVMTVMVEAVQWAVAPRYSLDERPIERETTAPRQGCLGAVRFRDRSPRIRDRPFPCRHRAGPLEDMRRKGAGKGLRSCRYNWKSRSMLGGGCRLGPAAVSLNGIA